MRILTALFVLALAAPLPADEPKAHRGLAYAEPKNERQTLDVYAPTTGKNLPVVVWIHGGGWQAGDKKEVHHKPQAFADKRKDGDLLGPPFGGKHFVQFITLDQADRPRPAIARQWVRHL